MKTPTRSTSVADPGAASVLGRFAADVAYYLAQEPRQLPSRYLYDDLGSALFDAICQLPWYGITRAEQRLLLAHGADVFRLASPVTTLVELGPGNGQKLATLIEAGGANAGSLLDVALVDLSTSALESAARTLARFEHVHATTHNAGYEAGLQEIANERAAGGRLLVLLLGSNIGNFDRPAAHTFVRAIRGELRPGDWFLLGADSIKPAHELLLAYDDPLGVTAAFNRNLLVRINRELGGNFDIDQFGHRAIWNAAESRIEMHLVAHRDERIRIDAAGLDFAMTHGERIWTESSYKYRPDDVVALLEGAGFRAAAQWFDPPDRFALILAEAV